MVSAIGVVWWYESPVCHRSSCDEDNAMKTRVALLFVILSLLATPTYGVDLKKGVGSDWFLKAHNWTGTCSSSSMQISSGLADDN